MFDDFDFEIDGDARAEDYTGAPKRFKKCYVDADTILHRAAKVCEDTYIVATHKKSGWSDRFKNVTEFWGVGKSITEISWLGKKNAANVAANKPTLDKFDFKITQKAELKPEFEGDPKRAIEAALSTIDFKIGHLKKHMDSEDYILIVSAGTGNYRNDIARTLGYKSSRGDKPMLYAEVKEAMTEKYSNKMMFSDMCEAEDIIGHISTEVQKTHGEDFDKWDVCASYVDKDVDHVYIPSINYDKVENGFRFPTKLECSRCLVTQAICGDPTDTIQGIPDLTVDVREMFNLRKGSGCGKTTAENLLKPCETEKEMWERAVYAYQDYYGMDPVVFTAHDGVEETWTWLDFLNETSILVKMQDFEGEIFNVEDKLKALGIEYKTQMHKASMKSEEELETILLELDDEIGRLRLEAKALKSEKKQDLLDRFVKINAKIDDIDNLSKSFYN